MFADSLQMSHACQRFWNCYKTLTLCSLLAGCTFSTSQLPKVARTCGVLSMFTSKCASRHNGVHFFNISISKSAPKLRCFVHFDFEMCFAPQRRALCRHLNFQKCSDVEVLCAFLLRNLIRATTVCTCLFLISLDGSAPAALASLLLDPPEPQIIGETPCFATFLPFRAPWCSFFFFSSLLFSSPLLSSPLLSSPLVSCLLFSSLVFSSLLFSDSSHLCFSIRPDCWSVASKLPSTSVVSIVVSHKPNPNPL